MKITNFSPLKDITSNSDSSFEMGKKMFNSITADSQKDTNTKLTKKWIGGNKDSSNYIKTKTVQAIGSVSFNGKLSYHSNNDINFVNNAISRTRAGGAIVPPKCSHKNLYYFPSMTGEVGDPTLTPILKSVTTNTESAIITITSDPNEPDYYYSYEPNSIYNPIDSVNIVINSDNSILTIKYPSTGNIIYIYSFNTNGKSGVLRVELPPLELLLQDVTPNTDSIIIKLNRDSTEPTYYYQYFTVSSYYEYDYFADPDYYNYFDPYSLSDIVINVIQDINFTYLTLYPPTNTGYIRICASNSNGKSNTILIIPPIYTPSISFYYTFTDNIIRVKVNNFNNNVIYTYFITNIENTDSITSSTEVTEIKNLKSNTEYTITVKAKTNTIESNLSNSLTLSITLPNIPEIYIKTIDSVTTFNINNIQYGVTYTYFIDDNLSTLWSNPSSPLIFMNLNSNTKKITVTAKNLVGMHTITKLINTNYKSTGVTFNGWIVSNSKLFMNTPNAPKISNVSVTLTSIVLTIDILLVGDVTYGYSIDGISYTPINSNPLTISDLTGNTPVTLKASTLAGESKVIIYTLPNAPQISIKSVTLSSITLKIITLLPYGVTYKYSTDNGLSYTLLNSESIITGLTSNTEYYITVKAINSSGESIVSNTLTQYTLPNTSNIKSSVTLTTIVLNIDIPQNNVTYKYSTDGLFYTPINSNPLIISGLTGNTPVTLKALNLGGESTVVMYTLPNAPQISIKSVTVSSITLNIITLLPYGVTYKYSTNGQNYTLLNSNSIITGLISNTEYSITVKAINSSGESIVSNTLTQYTLPNAPKISNVSVTLTSIVLTIDTPQDNVTYGYFTDGISYTPINSNSLTISGLTGNTPVTLKASTLTGESKVIIYTLPKAPIISIDSVTSSSVKLNISTPQHNVTYKYSTDNGVSYTSLKRSLIITGLTSKTHYSITVKAINSAGNSEVSTLTVDIP